MKLRTKIKCATVATSVLAVVALCGVSEWFARDRLTSLLESQVKALATTVAAGVDAESLVWVAETGLDIDLNSERFTQLERFVRGVQVEGHEGSFPIEFAYLMAPTKHGAVTGFDFVVDSSPRVLPSGAPNPAWDAPGTPYTAHAAGGEAPRIDAHHVTARLLHDRHGEWLSGYAPIWAADGRVVGVAGVDIDHAAILRQLDMLRWIAVGAAVMVSVAVYLLVDSLVDRFLRPLARMGAFVREIGEGRFDARLDIATASEFGAVSADLNAMAQSLADREHLARQNTALTVDVARKRETLEAITDVDTSLNEIQDLDILMERILADARRLLGCDAGGVLLREGDDLVLAYVQYDAIAADRSEQARASVRRLRVAVDGGSIAGYAAWSGESVVIDDAYEIPRDRPYQFNRSFDELTGYRTRAILTLPLRTSAGKSVGVLQLQNPLDATGAPRAGFTTEEVEALSHFASAATVALERAALTRSIVLRMIRMAELRDPSETGAHVNRVAAYSVILHEEWARRHEVDRAQSQRDRDVLRIAAMLHDVGKVGIADAVLKKPGRLTADEYRLMQQHCEIGARLFADHDSVLDRACLEVALHHHERWDGGGYPGIVDMDAIPAARDRRLDTPPPMKGDAIPIFARIVSVADVFDALSSKRQYKESWPEPRVLNEMRVNAGRQFDPELIDILLASIEKFRAVAARYA